MAIEVREAQENAKSRYAHAQVDGLLWFWPQDENPISARHQVDDKLRFLAPFDPVVWDRRRMAGCSTSWASLARDNAAVPFNGRWTRHCSRCGSFWKSSTPTAIVGVQHAACNQMHVYVLAQEGTPVERDPAIDAWMKEHAG